MRAGIESVLVTVKKLKRSSKETVILDFSATVKVDSLAIAVIYDLEKDVRIKTVLSKQVKNELDLFKENISGEESDPHYMSKTD